MSPLVVTHDTTFASDQSCKSVSHGNHRLATIECGCHIREGRPTTRESRPISGAEIRNLKGLNPMSDCVTIKTAAGVKVLNLDTYHAIRRAIPIFAEDRRVASYAALPNEGITEEIVRHIRTRMITNGDLPARAFSRRMERA